MQNLCIVKISVRPQLIAIGKEKDILEISQKVNFQECYQYLWESLIKFQICT